MQLFSNKYGEEGQDLIVIHGLFGMSDNWNTIGQKFSLMFKVHLLDLRNHGRSPHSIQFDYTVMCEDLLQYIEDQKIDKPIILGHSLGGKVAMNFAFKYPHKTEKLIVADISPRKYSVNFHKNLLTELNKISIIDFDSRKEIDNALASVVKDSRIRLFLMKNLYRNKHKEFSWRFNIKTLFSKIENISEANFVKGACSVPTHFLRGGDSDYITRDDQAIIKKYFSNVSITTIEGAGHWLHAESPEEFYNEVMKCCLL